MCWCYRGFLLALLSLLLIKSALQVHTHRICLCLCVCLFVCMCLFLLRLKNFIHLFYLSFICLSSRLLLPRLLPCLKAHVVFWYVWSHWMSSHFYLVFQPFWLTLHPMLWIKWSSLYLPLYLRHAFSNRWGQSWDFFLWLWLNLKE